MQPSNQILVMVKEGREERREERVRIYKEKEQTNNKLTVTEEPPDLLQSDSKGSQIAKGGYNVETQVCNDLNHNVEIRTALGEWNKTDSIGTFSQIKGTTKVDICNSEKVADATYRLQVKKTKKGQSGQVDRHWARDLVNNIPDLKPVEYMLKNLCELPLQSCGKLVDKSEKVKSLSTENYLQSELSILIDKLNSNKRDILNGLFYGNDRSSSPNYLCGVEYKCLRKLKKQELVEYLQSYELDTRGTIPELRERLKADNRYHKDYPNDEKRERLIIYKMSDVISYLNNQQFKIATSTRTIHLGNSILSLKRKGGDGGKKVSNQLQVHLKFSSLEIEDKLEIHL